MEPEKKGKLLSWILYVFFIFLGVLTTTYITIAIFLPRLFPEFDEKYLKFNFQLLVGLAMTASLVAFVAATLGGAVFLHQLEKLVIAHLVFVVLCILFSLITFIYIMIGIDSTTAIDYVNTAWDLNLNDSSVLMDQIQSSYECCGKDGPKDYKDFPNDLPSVCFEKGNATNLANLHERGCMDAATAAFSNLIIYGAVGTVIVLIIEIAGFAIDVKYFLIKRKSEKEQRNEKEEKGKEKAAK